MFNSVEHPPKDICRRKKRLGGAEDQQRLDRGLACMQHALNQAGAAGGCFGYASMQAAAQMRVAQDGGADLRMRARAIPIRAGADQRIAGPVLHSDLQRLRRIGPKAADQLRGSPGGVCPDRA